jgi:hypothetical protein
MFNNFFSENLAVYETMWKNMVEPHVKITLATCLTVKALFNSKIFKESKRRVNDNSTLTITKCHNVLQVSAFKDPPE